MNLIISLKIIDHLDFGPFNYFFSPFVYFCIELFVFFFLLTLRFFCISEKLVPCSIYCLSSSPFAI